jgi:hypothetical protein
MGRCKNLDIVAARASFCCYGRYLGDPEDGQIFDHFRSNVPGRSPAGAKVDWYKVRSIERLVLDGHGVQLSTYVCTTYGTPCLSTWEQTC